MAIIRESNETFVNIKVKLMKAVNMFICMFTKSFEDEELLGFHIELFIVIVTVQVSIDHCFDNWKPIKISKIVCKNVANECLSHII